MERLTVIPARIVDEMPASLWANGNLFSLFDVDVHFCSGGTRTIEFGGTEIGRGEVAFIEYDDDVASEPVSPPAAQAVLAFVELVARHVGREVKFTPLSTSSLTWLTPKANGVWVSDRLFDYSAGDLPGGT